MQDSLPRGGLALIEVSNKGDSDDDVRQRHQPKRKCDKDLAYVTLQQASGVSEMGIRSHTSFSTGFTPFASYNDVAATPESATRWIRQ